MFGFYFKLRDLKRILYNYDCRNILNFVEDENGLSICFIYWVKGEDRIDMVVLDSSVYIFRMILKDFIFCLRILFFIFVKII